MNKKAKLLFLTILVYGIPILLWSTIPFTKGRWGSFADSSLLNFLFYGTVSYSAIGIIFDIFLIYCLFLLLKPANNITETRVYLIYSGIGNICKWFFVEKLKKPLEISHEQKTSLLFYAVKMYFTPVMIGFLIDNSNSLIRFFPTVTGFLKSGVIANGQNIFLSLIYPALFYLILVIDTVIFAFGYIFESKKLKNIVRSVEPTALGWFVAIICYPPLNSLTANILGWYSSDFANFGNQNINVIAGFFSIALFIIYVWASIALGFKASNLTNRGIVSHGPYKYVRHPAYISKNLSWWLMALPIIKTAGFIAIFSLAVWTLIYYLRALTEERHLIKDPDYVEYSKKVKYMFIPGLI